MVSCKTALRKGLSVLSAYTLTLYLLLLATRESAAFTFCASDGPSSLICDLEAVFGDNEEIEYRCFHEKYPHPIDNHSSEFEELIESEKIVAGQRLEIEGAFISDDLTFVIPSDAEVAYLRNKNDDRRRRLPSTEKTFLVIYVKTTFDERPDKDAKGGRNSIKDDVFGSSGDPLNLANVFERCSNGAFDFKKSSTSDGVYEVTLDQQAYSADTSSIQKAVLDQVEDELGVTSLSSLADHVMLCLPYGTLSRGNRGWLGYAYVNHWLSVFNNEWCSSISTLAHELGHNLNLGHSGQPRTDGSIVEYGDQLGYMGYGYNLDDTPEMCFNAPKTHQLGWFSSYHEDLTVDDNFRYEGDLCAFTEVGSLPSLTQRMIVKLEGNSADFYPDIFISFNRAAGITVGTKEGKDKVVIHKKERKNSAPKSLRIADLGAGDALTLTVNGREVSVEVTGINTGSSPSCATVKISGADTEAPSVSGAPSLSTFPSQTPSLSLLPSGSSSSAPSKTPSISLSPSTSLVPTQSDFALTAEYLFGDFYAASKSGIMFDVSVQNDEIQITEFDISFFWLPGANVGDISTDVEIWATTDGGSYNGVKYNKNAWTRYFSGTINPTCDGACDEDDFLTTITLTTPIGVVENSPRGIFISNRDANNYINVAYNTDAEYTDDIVTIKRGKFSKYSYFEGQSSSDFCNFLPFGFAGILHYRKTGGMPSDVPSLLPSVKPSLSQQPSLSQYPSVRPSLSLTPSNVPSVRPSVNPSVSVMPSSLPSDDPSSHPSISSMPSKTPTISPTFTPTKNPTKSPTRSPTPGPSYPLPTVVPTDVPTPYIFPSASPTISFAPSDSIAPTDLATLSANPSHSPTVTRFKVITTSCYCRYPFRGVSNSQLEARFEAIVSIWTKAITAMIPKENWGVRVVRVGDRDVRRHLSTSRGLDEEGTIEIEVELTSTTTCESDDGCTQEEQDAALQSGFEVLEDVTQTATNGELIAKILGEAESAGLSDVFSDVSVDEVETDQPEIDIQDPTPFPSISPPKVCNDSPFFFDILENGNYTTKKCEWVSLVAELVPERCALPGVSDHCPDTCDTCEFCFDSKKPFQFITFSGTTKRKTCARVSTVDAETKLKRCWKGGIADTCRNSCNNCCINSLNDSFKSTFLLENVPGKSQDCRWLRKKGIRRMKNCGFGDVMSKCPGTCNACSKLENDDNFTFKLSGNETMVSKSCDWLNKGGPKRIRRRASYCSPGGEFYDAEIRRHCKSSCSYVGFCPVDDVDFTFKLGKKGEDVSCRWLSSNKKKLTRRRAEYCDIRGAFYDEEIRINCARGCGLCE